MYIAVILTLLFGFLTTLFFKKLLKFNKNIYSLKTYIYNGITIILLYLTIFFSINTIYGYVKYFKLLNEKEEIIDELINSIQTNDQKKFLEYQKNAKEYNIKLLIYLYMGKYSFWDSIFIHNAIKDITPIPIKDETNDNQYRILRS